MGFFDDAPEPEPEEHPEEDFRSPPWAGPPENEIGGTLPIDRVVVNTGEVAVALVRFTAYTTGLEFSLVAKRAPDAGPRRTGRRLGAPLEEDPADGLRFGLGFSDGRKVLADSWRGGESDPPILWELGGHGSERSWEQDYWLWPLPPPGELTAVISWPTLGPEERSVALDAGAILAAADRAVVLWPDDRPASGDEPLI